MKTPAAKPKVVTNSRVANPKPIAKPKVTEIVTFEYLKKLSVTEALKFIKAIFKAIQLKIEDKAVDLDEVRIIYFTVNKRLCQISVNVILFDRDTLQELVSYFGYEYEEEAINSNSFNLTTSGYTCGITEIGNFGVLKTVENATRVFLELAMYIESFYTTTANKTGMIQMTLVNKDHSIFIKLITTYLKPSTVINWNNPRSKNDLTTFIWV